MDGVWYDRGLADGKARRMGGSEGYHFNRMVDQCTSPCCIAVSSKKYSTKWWCFSVYSVPGAAISNSVNEAKLERRNQLRREKKTLLRESKCSPQAPNAPERPQLPWPPWGNDSQPTPLASSGWRATCPPLHLCARVETTAKGDKKKPQLVSRSLLEKRARHIGGPRRLKSGYNRRNSQKKITPKWPHDDIQSGAENKYPKNQSTAFRVRTG